MSSELIDGLRRRGFGVAMLSRQQAAVLQRAHREALRFFALPDDIKQQCSRHMVLPTVGPEQILIGHSKPTNAKELLRVYDAMPPRMPPPLRKSCRQARAILHELLSRCMLALCNDASVAASHKSNHHVVITKRSLRQLCRGACPLDFFLYNNRRDASTPCSAHVDRGFLHAIVASPVPGLELLERPQQRQPPPPQQQQQQPQQQQQQQPQLNDYGADGGWRAPTDLWPSLEPHAHVIVMANDALARLSRREPGRFGGGVIDACVHRVVRAENVPRLSISYELRPSFGEGGG